MKKEGARKKANLFQINQELRDDILAKMDVHSETIVLKTVIKYLNNGDIDRAIAGLEILGKDLAFEIYQKLTQLQQVIIKNFMIEKSYVSSDPQLLYHLGKEIQAELCLSTSWRILQEQGDRSTRDVLTRMDLAELQELCSDLSETALIRLLIYLEPSLLALLLQSLKPQSQTEFTRVKQALQRIHEASSLTSKDAEILQAARRQSKSYQSSDSTAIMHYYQAVLEKTDENIADELRSVLGQNLPSLYHKNQTKAEDIGEFLQLPQHMQQRSLKAMSNRELAYLLVGLPSQQRRLIEVTMGVPAQNAIRAVLPQLKGINNAEFSRLHQSSLEKLLGHPRQIYALPLQYQRKPVPSLALEDNT